jgi:hypothetical protein
MMNHVTTSEGAEHLEDFAAWVYCSIRKVEAQPIISVNLETTVSFMVAPTPVQMACLERSKGKLDIICRRPQCLLVGPSVSTTSRVHAREPPASAPTEDVKAAGSRVGGTARPSDDGLQRRLSGIERFACAGLCGTSATIQRRGLGH